MARQEGRVNAQLEAWLRIKAPSGEILECLIDTGFNGALMLPREVINRLNLTILGSATIAGMDGARRAAGIAEMEIEWLGERRPVEVIVSRNDESLIGTALLQGNRLAIDYIAYTVTISDEAR